MTEKIVTRPFQYGNEKESDWPPKFPTVKGFKGYWDREKKKFVEGSPPRREVFDQAPAIIQDTMDPYYHPKACVMVDSKSKLRDIDNACGTITTDKIQPANPSAQNERKRQLKKDRHEALHKAVAQIDAGTAPMSEQTRELCKKQNEIVANALPGLDPFNAAGRKNNARGKRYRK